MRFIQMKLDGCCQIILFALNSSCPISFAVRLTKISVFVGRFWNGNDTTAVVLVPFNDFNKIDECEEKKNTPNINVKREEREMRPFLLQTLSYRRQNFDI